MRRRIFPAVHAVFLAAFICSAAQAAGVAPQKADEALVVQLQTAVDDQRYLDAGRLLEQAQLTPASDSRLIYWAGRLSLARGRQEEALAYFRSVAPESSVRSAANEGMGLALLSLGRSEEALAALQAAVDSDPHAWRAWNGIATIFDGRHDWPAADKAYERAMAASGGAAMVLNNRGYSRLSQNKLDLAAADFVAALQKKPDLAQARSNLRLVLAMKGEYERATSGASDGDHAAVLNNAGFTAMLRGDYAKAKDLLAQAIAAKSEYYSRAAENLEIAKKLSDGLVQGSGNAARH